jgi:hypothetical protein
VGTSKVGEVYKKHAEYKLSVYKCMRDLEKMIISRSWLVTYHDQYHFMMVDFLRSQLENIDPRKMNGVCGGIACNTRILPGGKAVFFTGVTYDNEDGDKMIKISGRTTTSPKFEGIKINSFMENFGGGGHNNAAACNIKYDDMNEFIEAMGKFDFYRGEFR